MSVVVARAPFGALLAVVVVGLGFAARSEPVRDCSLISIADQRDVADHQYRAARFDDAEHTLRDAADCATPRLAEQLHLIASFYHQLGHAYRLGMASYSVDAMIQLRWAIEYDAMLGGAFDGELRGRLLDVEGRLILE